VTNQTYSNLEIIIVDDCSTDNTEDVVNAIGDSRITYYKLDQNRRACFARNYGAKNSHGVFIAFQDSDDIWHSDKLEKELSLLKTENVDLVFCGMNRVSENGMHYFPRYQVNCKSDFFWQELTLNAVSTQTILMRREVIDVVEFDVDFKKYQDWDFAIRAAEKFKIAYFHEALVESYVQRNSISVTINHYEALQKIYNKYSATIQQKPEIEASYRSMFGDCFRKNDSKTALKYYKQSLASKFNIKVFAKYLVSLLHLKK
jgi:glycosyltransferase involved in cell wall biosynthesis